MTPEPFRISVPAETLDDLRRRLGATRFIDDLGEPGWKLGLDVAYMRELAAYWQLEFDWRAQEAALNRFAQFRVVLKDGLGLHFIHERGRGPNPLPLVLTHGFPDSFARFVRLIPLLVDPERHGGDPNDAFDVVVPSLPGYGFSDKPAPGHGLFHVGDAWHELMTRHLGYSRYGAHGGDWGSFVSELLARDHAAEVVGIHLTDVPFVHSFQRPEEVTRAERNYLDAVAEFPQKQGAYALIQGSEPQALALALGDSPVGLAGWILEKFRRWSDCGGELERCFTRDELLTNVMLYWVTGTINSSFLPYHDIARAGAATWIMQKLKELAHRTRVPAGFAMFPKDLSSPPREWAERFFKVERWVEMPRGGHFAALEAPEALAGELRAFFRPLRATAAH